MNKELIDILNSKGIGYKTTNNPHELLINCTSGEHEDKTPSLSFNTQKSVFQCWSCGFKGGINKFLQSIGINTPINTAKTDIHTKTNILRERIENLRNSSTNLVLPTEMERFTYPYRMLPVEVMIQQGCFTTRQYGLDGYLCFPIFELGKLKFIEARLLNHVEGKPKWYRYPRNLDLSSTLYPLDKFKNTGTAILVEGLLDCLYLRHLGYLNTLCIFGTNGFNPQKAEILKNYGVVKIIPLMDGDVSGQKAAERIEFTCNRLKIHCQRWALDSNKDPKDYILPELKQILGEPTK
jgi:5S rRNA maturation endonuclease (ribonuclease M5)